MGTSITFGRLRGIPIGVHWSWFLVFGLVTWSLAWGYFPREYPTLSPLAYWLLGAVTGVLFFGSVLVHELGHSLVALHHKVPVRSITLFIVGGVAHMAQEPCTPGVEFRIAIAGPLTSLGLAVVFGSLWWLNQGVETLAAPSLWLARMNLLLAVFNLLPGFPLEGGRVLRAVVWKLTGSLPRATQVATFSGQVFAFGFMGWGVWTALGGHFLNGMWYVCIGWFLQNAAVASYAQTPLQELLRSVTVDRVMHRAFPQVSGQLTLQQLIDDYVLVDGQRCFGVVDGQRLRGLLTLTDITTVPPERRRTVTAADVMVPWEKVMRVQPDTELWTALQMMDEANVGQLPVIKEDTIAGVLARARVLQYPLTDGAAPLTYAPGNAVSHVQARSLLPKKRHRRTALCPLGTHWSYRRFCNALRLIPRRDYQRPKPRGACARTAPTS